MLKSDTVNKNEVIFEPVLYGSDKEDYLALYYTVNLAGSVDHLLPFMNHFGKLPTKAYAVVKITHVIEPPSEEFDGESLYKQMQLVKSQEVYETWDHIKTAHGNSNDNANKRSVLSAGNIWDQTSHYRTETLTLDMSEILAPDGKTHIDDMFIDFQAERNNQLKNFNWDIGNWKSADEKVRITQWYRDKDLKSLHGGSDKTTYETTIDPNGTTAGFLYRVHGLIEVNAAYSVRTSDGKEAPDNLYARIESDAMNDGNGLDSDGKKKANGNNCQTVRQIVIDINTSNAGDNQRPIFFFYDGPENCKRELQNPIDPDPNFGRESQPVIRNLNADFKGVLFVPNSDVVVNGNGKNFTCFIVAKSFKALMTESDFNKSADGKYYDKLDSNKEYFLISDTKNGITNKRFIDELGNVQYKELPSGLTTNAPASRDSSWRADKNDQMYKLSAFGLASSSYSSFNKVRLSRYSEWDSGKGDSSKNNGYADNFFLTERSDEFN